MRFRGFYTWSAGRGRAEGGLHPGLVTSGASGPRRDARKTFIAGDRISRSMGRVPC